MSQHDYVIDNANGAAVRVDLNNLFGAIQSNNSGATSPTTTTPFQWWFDTTQNDLKMRNSGDTAWVAIFDLTGSTVTPFRGTALLGDAAEATVGTVNLTDLPNIEDIQNQQGIYLAAGGSVNAFTLTLIPAIAGYVEGQYFAFKANAAITGAPTLNVNSKGAGAITWPNGDVLVTGDILINQHVTVRRTASAFVMLGSRTIATTAQAEAGLQNTRIMSALRTKEAILALAVRPEIFTVDGTYNVPAGITKVLVELFGAGGGGGDTTGALAAGGGGSGGYCKAFVTVTGGGSETVQIGLGGAAGVGASGTNGEDTTFGSLATAVGGTGGNHGNLGGAGGASGGASTTGTALLLGKGGPGQNRASSSVGGNGGVASIGFAGGDVSVNQLTSGGRGSDFPAAGKTAGQDGFMIVTPIR